MEMVLASEPSVADAGVLWAGMDRAELRRQHAVGELQELEFEAVVFRAAYPNWNYVRFQDEEMNAFAASFVGVPFLRNHDMEDIAARDGIVTGCWMDGADQTEMHARIKLTTEEGIRDFLAGRIDRFSISWFKRGETLCSVCGKDVFGAECRHVPGRTYAVGGLSVACEMVQVEPLGREISAVNVPAAAGTHVLGELVSELVSMKEQMMEEQDGKGAGVVAGTAPGSAHKDRVEGSDAAPTQGRGDGLRATGEVRGEVEGVKAELVSLREEVVTELRELKIARNRLQLETSLEQSGLPEAARGLWPTFALLPVDLYDTALEVFGYGTGDVGKPNSGGTAQTVYPYGESQLGDPRPIPVVVPEWTDATDWAQIVDPRLHPVIQMAYANAPQGGLHALPEIYEVRSETAGLMFTNDTLPITIRDWWAYGVATYVGVGKNNVSG
jgi:hypothetical protein